MRENKHWQVNENSILTEGNNGVWRVTINGEQFFKTRIELFAKLYKTYLIHRIDKHFLALLKYGIVERKEIQDD